LSNTLGISWSDDVLVVNVSANFSVSQIEPHPTNWNVIYVIESTPNKGRVLQGNIDNNVITYTHIE
jgi:hypothetical protein